MESILPLCSYFLMNGIEQQMDETFRKKATDAYHQLMDKGLRVLAFAYKESKEHSAKGEGQEKNIKDILQSPIPNPQSLEEDLVFLGLIGLEDPPRPEVPEAIRKCHECRHQGDHDHRVTEAGQQLRLHGR